MSGGNVVDRSLVPGAVAINSIVFNLARMIGPALGGAAIAMGAVDPIFFLNVISYLGFTVILSRTTRATRPDRSAASLGAGWMVPLSGLRDRHRTALIYFALLAVCLRPVFELLPSFAAGGQATARRARSSA